MPDASIIRTARIPYIILLRRQHLTLTCKLFAWQPQFLVQLQLVVEVRGGLGSLCLCYRWRLLCNLGGLLLCWVRPHLGKLLLTWWWASVVDAVHAMLGAHNQCWSWIWAAVVLLLNCFIAGVLRAITQLVGRQIKLWGIKKLWLVEETDLISGYELVHCPWTTIWHCLVHLTQLGEAMCVLRLCNDIFRLPIDQLAA